MMLKLTTPEIVDASIQTVLAALELRAEDAQWLKFDHPAGFLPRPSECHLNARIERKLQRGGSVTSGWVVWQDKANAIVVAMFHALWRSPEGALRDVTPREDGEEKVLFVPDEQRRTILSSHLGIPKLESYENWTIQRGRVVLSGKPKVYFLDSPLVSEFNLVAEPPVP
jgi:hypothetical protein